MTQLTSVAVAKGRVRQNELGAAWITASADLSAPGLLSRAGGGASSALPGYRSAAQQAGGQALPATRLDDDGTLHLLLEMEVAAGTSALVDGSSFALVVDAAGGGPRIDLPCTHQGMQAALSVKLAGDDLRRTQAALFDVTPNAAVVVTQRVRLAARQTDDFIRRNWSNEAIRQGLIDQFGGIPFDSAATYIAMANGGDADFRTQYLLLDCVFALTVGLPPLPGYVPWQVDWNGRAHTYYQDNRERSRVFYLPDRFELALGPDGSPTISLLQFSVPAAAGPVAGSAVDGTRALFRVFARAVADPARLQDAAQVLRGRIGAAPQMTSLEDGHGVSKRLSLYLPNAQASSDAGTLVPQPQASIDLATGLRNELDLGFAQFRALWAAIFSAAPEKTLFRGQVDVALAGGRYQDRIEFVGRLPGTTPASFFDDILDTSTRSTYPVRFTVQTMEKVFQGTPAVLQVGLNFQGAAPLALTRQALRAELSLERSIRDIVLGRQPPDRHPYRLRVVREDGSMGCSEQSADSSDPDLWVLPAMVDQCTAPCAS